MHASYRDSVIPGNAAPTRDAAQCVTDARNAMTVTSMLALHKPDWVAPHVDTIVQVGLPFCTCNTATCCFQCIPVESLSRLRIEHVYYILLFSVPFLAQVGFSPQLEDAWLARYGALTLTHMAPVLQRSPAAGLSKAYAALSRVVVASRLPERNWYSAAESALGALYALHPSPSDMAQALLGHMAQAALQTAASGDASQPAKASAQDLSRFFFVLGQVALQQLVLVEALAARVRRLRADKEKAALEARERKVAATAAKGKVSGGEDDDIAAQVGMGAVSADAELDRAAEAIEAQLLTGGSLVGSYGDLLARLCMKPVLGAQPGLQASCLLALTKLMAVDARFCEDNVALLFTMLSKR